MYSNIKQLRHRGVRRTEREVANDPGVFGEVILHRVGGILRMTVREWGNQRPDARLISDLWEPICQGLGGESMSWRGYQRAGRPDDEAQPTYLQEWRITIIGPRPPADQSHSVLATYGC
jgi:hypothetical protein